MFTIRPDQNGLSQRAFLRVGALGLGGFGAKKGTFTISPAFPLTGRHNANMPRTARASRGGYCYHVLNRGNACD